MGYDKGWIGTTYVGEPTPEPKDQVAEIKQLLIESGRGWGTDITAEYVGPYDLEKVGRKGEIRRGAKEG